MVLEFLDSDLELLIKDSSIIFQPADVKSWFLMLMRGLHHCHKNFVLHRVPPPSPLNRNISSRGPLFLTIKDLKPSNLLISQTGHLKLADFGLASTYAIPYTKQTSQVVTRWYRAPELLLGARHYGPAIDIWAAGCIFAELMLRTPYLPADTDASQLDMCFRALGTPSETEWPGMRLLPGWTGTEQVRTKPMGGLQGTFSAAGEDALDLLGWMLRFDPGKRPSAVECLRSGYFENLPRPTRPERLPRKGDLGAVAETLKRSGEEGLDRQPVKKVYVG